MIHVLRALRSLVLLLTMMLLTQVGWGQVTLAGWDFFGYTSAGSSPQSPTTSGSNISIGGLTRGSALGTSGTPASNGWGTSVSVTSPTNFSTAITANSFISFTLKANSGYTLSLNEISAYNVRRSSTGPTSGQWQYSVDGSNFANIGSTITWGSTTTASGNSQTSISLSAISSLQSLGSAITVTFRCVFWGATATTGGWYLNNFQSGNDFVITGTVASAATAPTLTAASSATVDNDLNITFTDDATWRAAVTSVKYGSNTLTPSTDYTLSAGTLTLKPSGSAGSGLRTSGTQTVTVLATNYTDATVSQAIGVGAANKLTMNIQPAAPSSNGGALATQPKVNITDQYGNLTSSTASITAAVGAGAWTLGGTASVAAVSGTTTFSGLTAVSAAAVTGATISFSSGVLTGVTSNTFNIPAPPPSNDNCSGATTLYVNAAAVAGDFTASTPMTGAPKNDVFYTFTPTVTGSFTVTINTFSVASDKDIYVYSVCPSTYSASTNVVASGTGTGNSSETATGTLNAGTTYKVLIQDYGGGGGTFSISVTAPIYYSKSMGNLNSTSTWGTNTDGSGSNPSNFTSANQIFCIYNNPTPTIAANWAVSGSGSKIVVGDGSNACNFTIPSGLTCTATIDVAAAATLTIQSSTSPTFGTLAATSTVVYSSSSSQTVTAGTYSNLDLTGGDRTISGTVNIAGAFTPGSGAFTVTGSTIIFNGSTPQTIPAATYNSITSNNSAGCTTNGNVIVGGTLTVSQNLTVGASSVLTINSGGSVTIASSQYLTVSASGTFQNNSTTAFTISGTMTVNGTYVHNANSQTIPSANTTYTTGSYLKVGNGGSNITTVNPVLPACSASNAPNVIWDCPQQSQTNIFLSATPVYVNNLTIVNTGTGYVSNGLTSTARVLNVLGDLSILGGKYYLTGSGLNTVHQTLNVSGNVSISGGTLDLNAGSNSGNGVLNILGNLSYTSGVISRSNTSSGKAVLSFNGVSPQTINGIPFVGSVDMTINNSSGVSLISDLTVSGTTTLTAGLLSIGNDTLTLSGSLSGGSSSSYVKTDGTGSLVVNSISTTGKSFPIGNSTYNPVTISNGSGHNWSARVEDAVNNVQTPFDYTKAVLRTWHIVPSTNPPTSGADITFQYNDGDANQLGSNYLKTENLQLWHYGTSWTTAGTAMTPTGTANGVRTVTQTGLTRFSPYALANVSGPLPATLLSFSGYKDGFQNQLRWVTATETNNHGFQVERSSDGLTYQSIGFVNSLAIGGNSQAQLKYSFIDARPTGIKQYYRLKQTDIDGRNTLSNILLIQGDKPTAIEIASAFPNPSNGQITLLLSAPSNENIRIRLFDMAGRVLETRQVNLLTGNNSIAFDLSQQANGQYLIQAGEKTIRVVRE